MSSKTLLAAASLICLATSSAQADVYCVETVQNVKVYANGAVMFATDQTCSFCQVGGSTDAIVNRGYAALATALATGKQVQFYWPGINSCSTQNAAYAIPSFISLVNS